MTEQTAQSQVVVSVELTVEQINVVLSALGKLPTETGVFPLRQFIAQQAQEKVDAIMAAQAPADEPAEDAPIDDF
jgi:hypothetical protein